LDEARTQLTIEFVDTHGSVVVAADGGARFPGTLRRVPTSVAFGERLDVMLVVGDESAVMALRAMGNTDVVTGAVVGAALLQLDVGGLDLVPRPTVAVSHAESDGVGLSGNIEDVPMAELVQLMCATRRTAEVELRHLGRYLGSLGFAEGRAISAVTVDGIGGVEAFYALAGLEIGAFAVRYNRRTTDENLTGDTLFLLLESARRVDEARRGPEPEPEPEFDLPPTVAVNEPEVPAAVASSPEAPAPVAPAVPRRSSSSSSSSSASPSRRRRSADAATEVSGRAASMGQFSGFFAEFSAARAHQKSKEGAAVRSQEGVAVDPADVVEERSIAPTAGLAPNVGDMMDKDTDIVAARDLTQATVAAE
jgi:hypothetical protein